MNTHPIRLVILMTMFAAAALPAGEPAGTKDALVRIMGPAVIDTTIQGTHIRCWVMRQSRHRELMEKQENRKLMGMDSDPMDTALVKDPTLVHMGMGKGTSRMMDIGTHHVLLNVTDSVSGNEIVNTSAKLEILSPSNRRSTVQLKQIMNNFGHGVTMKAKGRYRLTLDVNVNGFSRIEHFIYQVK